MPALNLVSADGAALFLESREGLPASVAVRAAAENPFWGGCPTVTVEAWKSGTSVLLDRKTFTLRDPWSWCGLSCEDELDCAEVTTLLLGGYAGPVTFLLKDEDGALVGRSQPVTLNSLPDGSAVDEQGGGLGDILNGDSDGKGLLGEIADLVKWGVIGGLLIAVAPRVIDLFDND